MTKELKKKIDKIVREYFTSSMTFSLYRNLKALAYDVAEEATKERQEENKQAKEIISKIIELEPDSVYFCEDYKDERKAKWYEVIAKAEAFLKEDQNEKKRKPYS